ncbi:YciI family protein [Symbiopectobacterium purcellii]|uniref:YciI family protein n=1 Tax=Symbiopectobacterium purcellii TaxID=2871826 RepID=A0ABX9AI48_9ENTR|nr:YciI family protein [Symbiopectobacterium purcellii]QZN94840.1 YciI family protein [Symbiopectobacterium purcellii]
MFLITITVNENITAEQHASLFPRHAQWFKKYFDAGNFLMIGPYTDCERAGVIIASAKDRDELMALLAEDAYFSDLAKYDI